MRKVLIVEDDEAMAVALKDGFQFEGFQVHMAKDGVSGLKMASETSPDVVILDVTDASGVTSRRSKVWDVQLR